MKFHEILYNLRCGSVQRHQIQNKFTERQRCSMIEYKTKQIKKLPNTLPGFKRKLKKHTKYAHILLFYS